MRENLASHSTLAFARSAHCEGRLGHRPLLVCLSRSPTVRYLVAIFNIHAVLCLVHPKNMTECPHYYTGTFETKEGAPDMRATKIKRNNTIHKNRNLSCVGPGLVQTVHVQQTLRKAFLNRSTVVYIHSPCSKSCVLLFTRIQTKKPWFGAQLFLFYFLIRSLWSSLAVHLGCIHLTHI